MDTLNQPISAESKKKSKFLRAALIISIVIVLNLFFNYTLSLIYKEPVLTNFCPNNQVTSEITTKTECIAEGGQWNQTIPVPQSISNTPASIVTGYCDPNYTCEQNFQNASDAYSQNVFIILV